MRKRRTGIIAGLILIGSVIFNILLFQKYQSLENLNRVTRVIDGDTLVLQSGQTLRLINVEAPELEFCGGAEAKKNLEDLVLNKNITYEIVSPDVFNRSLALVYVGKSLVNEIVLENGWGRYDGSPNPKRETIKAGFDEAVKNKKGIFRLCVAEKPDNPKCLIKGNIDRHDKGSKTYYFPGCANYQITIVEKDLGEAWFCSEKEAIAASFQKSSNCYGKAY